MDSPFPGWRCVCTKPAGGWPGLSGPQSPGVQGLAADGRDTGRDTSPSGLGRGIAERGTQFNRYRLVAAIALILAHLAPGLAAGQSRHESMAQGGPAGNHSPINHSPNKMADSLQFATVSPVFVGIDARRRSRAESLPSRQDPLPTKTVPETQERSVTTDDLDLIASAEARQQLQQWIGQDAGEGLNQQLKAWAIENLPDHWVDDRQWNRTEELATLIPRSKPLIMKHGTWRKYEIRPLDPERELAIRLQDVRPLPDQKFGFVIECDFAADLAARQAEWRRGVQVYSVQVDITTRLTLQLQCEVGVTFDFRDSPTLVIAPTVNSTTWETHDFKVHRVSKLGGEFSQQVTKAARKWLDNHQSEYQAKLTTAINRQIQKKPEKLRIRL